MGWVEMQRVRGLSWLITQKAHPQTSWVSKMKKQAPSWVVRPQMAPQSPQKKKKKNKGSDPNLASAWGERKVWGWGGRLQARASPGGKDTTQQAVVQVGAGAPPQTIENWPSSYLLSIIQGDAS